MSITERVEKIKSYMMSKDGADIGLVLVVILASLGSFGLGRLSATNSNTSPVIIERNGGVEQIKQENNDFATSVLSANSIKYKEDSSNVDTKSVGISSKEGALIVASKRGNKYYFTWCSGAKNLSEANKIYFNSEDEAIKAGYSKSTSCK